MPRTTAVEVGERWSASPTSPRSAMRAVAASSAAGRDEAGSKASATPPLRARAVVEQERIAAVRGARLRPPGAQRLDVPAATAVGQKTGPERRDGCGAAPERPRPQLRKHLGRPRRRRPKPPRRPSSALTARPSRRRRRRRRRRLRSGRRPQPGSASHRARLGARRSGSARAMSGARFSREGLTGPHQLARRPVRRPAPPPSRLGLTPCSPRLAAPRSRSSSCCSLIGPAANLIPGRGRGPR